MLSNRYNCWDQKFKDLLETSNKQNRGILRMTKEHIFLCLALKIPFIIVITKIAIWKENIKHPNQK